MQPTVRFEIDSDRVATITFDSPGKSVNTLAKQVWADLDRALDEAERAKPRGMIVNRRGHDEFVHARLFDELVQTVAHRFGRTNE